MWRRFFLCVGLLGAWTVVAAQTLPPAYEIGPKDLLEVRVQEDSSLNGEYRVSDSGEIELPYAGRLDIGGLTAREASQQISDKLQLYLQRATVSVQIVEFRSRPIVVIGAVRNPGHLPFSGRWTLLEVLSEAGGLSDNHGDTIYVLRRPDNGLTDQIAIPVRGLFVDADPTLNIPVFANDLINIPAAQPVTVYCLGEVQQPGEHTFTSSERITVMAALGKAGGLTERASSKIRIRRARSSPGEKPLVVNYKALIEGKIADPELQEGDTVFVKEAFF